ncbi:MAG: ABC transporter ATP-binding protein [Suilimivivens sp.]
MRKQNQSADMNTRQTTKQVWRNNWFLIKLCFSASPLYIITMTLDVIRSQFFIFLEHTYGIGYVLEAAEFHYPIREVAVFLIGIAICITLGMVFSVIVNNYWAVRELPKVQRKVKMMLYEKAKDLDLQCYDNPDYYNELVLAISEADKQIDRCITFLRNVASGVTEFLSVGIYFLVKDKFSVLIAALAFAIAFIFNQLYNQLSYKIRVSRNPFERKREYVKRIFYLNDYAKELRLNQEASTLLFEDFKKANEDVYQVEKCYAKKRFLLSFLKRYIGNDFISDVVYISYLVYRATIMKAISFSSVAILYNSFGNLKWNMRIFTDIYPYACETSLYVQKILDFLDYEPKIQSQRKLPVSTQAKAVELRNVSFSYGEKYGSVINDVSLSIAPGEKIALVGYNGAGKTTLIKLIMRLYDPSRGEILLDGVNIKDYDVEKYRHSIGTVFQDFKIFGGSVVENVLLDLNDGEDDSAVTEKVRKALTHSGLWERIQSLPNGLDTQLTTEFAKDGVNLSGGESQKLAIGRVFYKDAGLIILDEPSSALDPIAEYQLNHSMLEATENKTVIFISHRLSTTRLADRIFLLEKGRIAEQGTHEELLARNGRYAAMWRAQAGQYIEV